MHFQYIMSANSTAECGFSGDFQSYYTIYPVINDYCVIYNLLNKCEGNEVKSDIWGGLISGMFWPIALNNRG